MTFARRLAITSALLAVITVAVLAAMLAKEGDVPFSLLRRQEPSRRQPTEWRDVGPTPLHERGYRPQGLAWVDGRLLFANSWKDTRSRVYLMQPETLAVDGWFDMPDEAVHTSGLDWDGEHVWAVDWVSNRCYQIRLSTSLESHAADVVSSFDTTLLGTSACCLVSFQGETLLAISSHRFAGKTLLVRHHEAAAAGTARDAIVFEYLNEGFSQGLTFDGQHLYESENKLGLDVVNRLDLDALAREGRARAATLVQFPAPADAVEDLAWDGERMWTSDEVTFRFYVTRLPAAP